MAVKQVKQLNEMFSRGQIPIAHAVWIDAYNRVVNRHVAGTILTNYNSCNLKFVTILRKRK